MARLPRMSAENEDTALLKKHVEQLGEHFDSVIVFGTRHDPAVEGGTVTVFESSGNWLAARGQVRDWQILQDEKTRERAHTDDE